MSVRVRFAPSPTGSLHLGGLRTALFNLLFARQNGGQFLLRVEDTDTERFVPGAAESLMNVLDVVGLTPDEGPRNGGPHAPYTQSERQPLYQEHAKLLLHRNAAYCCFCTPDTLAAKRTAAQEKGRPTLYDRTCLHLTPSEVAARLAAGQPHAVRMLVPPGESVVHDLVFGEYRVANASIEDAVLLKSDGLPTYHLANIVDDHFMRISHVIRGQEWLPSTPKHLMLYAAFGWTPPAFAHLPLLVTEDRKKLSKRHAAASVEGLLKMVPPSALINYVAFLGWAPAVDLPGEVAQRMTLADLLGAFKLSEVNRAPAAVDVAKLRAISAMHIAAAMAGTPVARAGLLAMVRPYLEAAAVGSPLSHRLGDAAFAERLMAMVAPRAAVFDDFTTEAQALLRRPTAEAVEAAASAAGIAAASTAALASDLRTRLAALPSLNADTIRPAVAAAAKALRLAPKAGMLGTRALLTATDAGPPLGEIVALLGVDEVMVRLQHK